LLDRPAEACFILPLLQQQYCSKDHSSTSFCFVNNMSSAVLADAVTLQLSARYEQF